MINSNGRSRIANAFTRAKLTQTAALMPYFTLGYPDMETSLSIIEAIAPFSDLLELGVPFSDPLADGPTIQNSTQVALEKGTTTAVCLEIVETLRSRGVRTPIMLMGYVNPTLAYGESAYVSDAARAGVDGFIIPDLPPEEAGRMEALVEGSGQALIHFLAPTSSPARIELAAEHARGFLYLVSVTGVTGARQGIQSNLAEFVGKVRAQTDLPLAVGFGIGSAEQAAIVGKLADGVIVGSALINAVNRSQDKPTAAVHFVRSLRQALLQNKG